MLVQGTSAPVRPAHPDIFPGAHLYSRVRQAAGDQEPPHARC